MVLTDVLDARGDKGICQCCYILVLALKKQSHTKWLNFLHLWLQLSGIAADGRAQKCTVA